MGTQVAAAASSVGETRTTLRETSTREAYHCTEITFEAG